MVHMPFWGYNMVYGQRTLGSKYGRLLGALTLFVLVLGGVRSLGPCFVYGQWVYYGYIRLSD